jgi:hypothetical protein
MDGHRFWVSWSSGVNRPQQEGVLKSVTVDTGILRMKRFQADSMLPEQCRR